MTELSSASEYYTPEQLDGFSESQVNQILIQELSKMPWFNDAKNFYKENELGLSQEVYTFVMKGLPRTITNNNYFGTHKETVLLLLQLGLPEVHNSLVNAKFSVVEGKTFHGRSMKIGKLEK